MGIQLYRVLQPHEKLRDGDYLSASTGAPPIGSEVIGLKVASFNFSDKVMRKIRLVPGHENMRWVDKDENIPEGTHTAGFRLSASGWSLMWSDNLQLPREIAHDSPYDNEGEAVGVYDNRITVFRDPPPEGYRWARKGEVVSSDWMVKHHRNSVYLCAPYSCSLGSKCKSEYPCTDGSGYLVPMTQQLELLQLRIRVLETKLSGPMSHSHIKNIPGVGFSARPEPLTLSVQNQWSPWGEDDL